MKLQIYAPETLLAAYGQNPPIIEEALLSWFLLGQLAIFKVVSWFYFEYEVLNCGEGHSYFGL
jgi:hypothetical protein